MDSPGWILCRVPGCGPCRTLGATAPGSRGRGTAVEGQSGAGGGGQRSTPPALRGFGRERRPGCRSTGLGGVQRTARTTTLGGDTRLGDHPGLCHLPAARAVTRRAAVVAFPSRAPQRPRFRRNHRRALSPGRSSAIPGVQNGRRSSPRVVSRRGADFRAHP